MKYHFIDDDEDAEAQVVSFNKTPRPKQKRSHGCFLLHEYWKTVFLPAEKDDVLNN
jgi:hypothetical protein